MQKLIALTTMLTLLAASCSVPAAADAPTPKQQIQQVMARFQQAVIDKDKAALTGLFLTGHTSWIAVLDESSYRAMHATHPDASRFKPGSPAQFIDAVTGHAERMQEDFSNVRIETDGSVASVYFDFVFLDNGKPANRGSEAWQLVDTGDGWKINALVYSVALDTARMQ